MTDAEIAGLAEANVVQFADMGFPRDKVVSYLGVLWTESERICIDV
jgi:hypothetical protein